MDFLIIADNFSIFLLKVGIQRQSKFQKLRQQINWIILLIE